eukprot:CAMPEP_0172025258 /NCGR_PEP_ID=MMETSP1041-20130122/15794_1 /TAXON_ID=464988 /ORGANISM="Hemiselmis andersenii, Strain CCMP439" /LENGTH=129 /DNA_ID=CAMNT_0012680927 /DNA_START=155 /DNA_END=540 /DNA_ORIENTATION=+
MADQVDNEEKRRRLASAPDGYVCPLSMDVLVDPVQTVDGHTYERREIEAWLKSHDTSPLTLLPLTRDGRVDKSLTPNIALRKAIYEWAPDLVDAARRASLAPIPPILAPPPSQGLNSQAEPGVHHLKER